MKLKAVYPIYLLLLLLFTTACSSGNMPKVSPETPETPPSTNTHFVIESIVSNSIEITSSYDSNPNKEASAALASYDDILGEDMNTIIGFSEGMDREALAGLAAKTMATEGNKYLDDATVDIGFVNFGGIRATINSGDVLRKDIYSIFAFENELVILPLTGQELKTLVFENNASHIGPLYNVSINTTSKELKVKGQSVDETKVYWIATLDYLADGNSGLETLANLSLANQIIKPKILLRNIVLEYVKNCTNNGKHISYEPNEYTSVK